MAGQGRVKTNERKEATYTVDFIVVLKRRAEHNQGEKTVAKNKYWSER